MPQGGFTGFRPTVRAGAVWPPRRLAVGALTSPALFTGLVAAGGGWSPRVAPGWTGVVALVAVVGAATLATYLPRRGSWLRLEIGCTPCAAAAVMTVVAAAAILTTAPHQLLAAFAALGVAGLGLRQRLAETRSCAAPQPGNPRGRSTDPRGRSTSL